MLGKLLKHDIKETGRLLLPLNLIIIVITFIGIALGLTPLFGSQRAWPLLTLLIMTYCLALLAVSGASFFYPIIHYYRSIFSRQGYLTLTLPLSTWTILGSKVITGFLWYLANVLISIFSIIAVIAASAVDYLTMDYFAEFILELQYTSYSMQNELGMGLISFLIITAGIVFLSLFYSLMMGYFSVTVGQLYGKHKIVGSVLAYIIIYFIMNTIYTLVFLPNLIGVGMYMGGPLILWVSYGIVAGLSILFGGGFYFGSGIIIQKKVNLD
ncbi:MAG: hypothetical protein FWE25_04500 [Lachnospiraceae bacterium]|nr:hypothetical protein [Lachnospiraceae bacterium]